MKFDRDGDSGYAHATNEPLLLLEPRNPIGRRHAPALDTPRLSAAQAQRAAPRAYILRRIEPVMRRIRLAAGERLRRRAQNRLADAPAISRSGRLFSDIEIDDQIVA